MTDYYTSNPDSSKDLEFNRDASLGSFFIPGVSHPSSPVGNLFSSAVIVCSSSGPVDHFGGCLRG